MTLEKPNDRGQDNMSRVHIEFKRVQTFLFAVPRLRAMVGANTLLGEVLRDQLPALARKQTSSWTLARLSWAFPALTTDDPLADYDDPATDARYGIVARDGGHFEASFTSGARAFAEAAGALVRRALPGLRFRISIDDEVVDSDTVGFSKELPVLAPCEWAGRGLASVLIKQGTERAEVSLDVSRRHEAARQAEEGRASDLASLLVSTTRARELPRPQTFQDLAGDGYLALIHADGNGVGASAPPGDAERAAFFYRNRVLMRRALHAAIEASCVGVKSAPLVLLMLGGDDILVVSKAKAALPFVVSLCENLVDLQRKNGNPFELTLGVGVVFARPTIPIHRLHETAERLASSAKRRFRGFRPQQGRSVVDWAIYTDSALDDIEEVRRRDWLRGSGGTLRILSQRPVAVIGQGLDSLQGLLSAANKLKDAPRSQLRYLVDQLPEGKALSDLAFTELSPDAHRALDEVGITRTWSETSEGALRTPLLDLIEVYEISRLGRAGTTSVGAGFTEEDDGEENSHVKA